MIIKNRQIKKTKLAGFISAELGIGILVTSVLSIAGFLAIKNVQGDTVQEEFIKDHITVSSNIESALSKNKNFLNSSTETDPMVLLTETGMIPDSMLSSSGVTHQFGGAVDIFTGYHESWWEYGLIYSMNDKNDCIEAVNTLATTYPTRLEAGFDGESLLDERGLINIDAALTACANPVDIYVYPSFE